MGGHSSYLCREEGVCMSDQKGTAEVTKWDFGGSIMERHIVFPL